MYSYEIDAIMRNENYIISANTYIDICSTSPQINYTHYEPYGDYFEIWTDDRCYWKFNVYKGEKGNDNN